jgi:hypothetical protein
LSIGQVVRGVIRQRAGLWGLSDDVAYRAMIVATELASNAVLHAAPPYVLRLSSHNQRVRIAIQDSLGLTPALRQYDALALTGRGLRLVADCSTSWGVRGREAGKEVWAEVPFLDDGAPPATMQSSGIAAPREPVAETRMVRFCAVPVGVYLALQEWNDAVVRECELIAALEPVPTDLPARLLELAVRLSGRFASERENFREVTAQARADGASTVDLDERWPATGAAAVAAADAFLAMMEELDEFCRTDILLAEPPDPDVVRLRRWFVTEMRSQLLDEAAPLPFRETV